MSDFLINFLANVLADALLAIALYIIVTQPGERRRNREMIAKSLGLLKAEAQVNFDRAEAYSEALTNATETIVSLFPLRYSRGAWNALKETGFFSSLSDAHLKYYLFRMNEATLVANKNLRKLQLAYLEGKEGDLRLLIETAQNESKYVLEVLGNVLQMLHGVEVPDFAVEDPFEAELLGQPAPELHTRVGEGNKSDKKYAVFFNSVIYHVLKTPAVTVCGKPIHGSAVVNIDRIAKKTSGRPVPELFADVPPGLRLCQTCARVRGANSH